LAIGENRATKLMFQKGRPGTVLSRKRHRADRPS
jgi:hypothetical protein